MVKWSDLEGSDSFKDGIFIQTSHSSDRPLLHENYENYSCIDDLFEFLDNSRLRQSEEAVLVPFVGSYLKVESPDNHSDHSCPCIEDVEKLLTSKSLNTHKSILGLL